MARPNHRRRREEEDQESVRQKQLDEQVLEKKLQLRHQFQHKEKSSRLLEGQESTKRDRNYRDLLDQVTARNVSLKNQLEIYQKHLSIATIETEEQLSYYPDYNEIDESGLVSPVSAIDKSHVGIDSLRENLFRLSSQHLGIENQMYMEYQLEASLINMKAEIQAQKQKTVKKVQELRRIHQVLHTNFDDHLKLQSRYLTDESKVTQVLDQTKKQLTNLHIIEKAYTIKVMENGKNRKKAIERDESLLGHVQVRLEEAKRQNELLSRQVDDLHQQEALKQSRHKEFYYIGQYVSLFEELEKFIVQGEPDEIVWYYFNLCEQETIQGKTHHNSRSPKASLSPDSHTSKQIYRTMQSVKFDVQIPIQKTQSIKQGETGQREKRLSEIFFSKGNEFDRLQIVNHVEQFYNHHPEGPIPLVRRALKIYNQLQVKQNSLESVYQDKINEQKEKKRQIELLISQCSFLMEQNQQVEKIESDASYNKNFDNQQVALDSGMIKVVKPELSKDQEDPSYFRVVFHESNEQDLTTINKVVFQGTECSHENSRISHEFKLNEFFILNLYTYVSELLCRMCYAVVWLSEYTQMVPLDLDSKCVHALKHIAQRDLQIWIPTYSSQNTIHHAHTTPDMSKNFLQIFQSQNSKQDKRGSFVSIFNRKKSQPLKAQNQLTNLSLNPMQSQSFVPMQSGSQHPGSQNLVPQPPTQNQKLGSFLKMLHQSSSFAEENQSDNQKAPAQEMKEDKVVNQVKLMEQFHQKIVNCPKANEEWACLLRNDKISSFFIRNEQSQEIIDAMAKQLQGKNYKDDIGLMVLLYDTFMTFVEKGTSSLKELLTFIFVHYREVVTDVNNMVKITKEDIKDLQHEKERDSTITLLSKVNSSQTKVPANPFLHNMQKKQQEKHKLYKNSDEFSAQLINFDGARLDNDDQKYYVQFVNSANAIQRKNPILRQKLTRQALQEIEDKKKVEMEENYFSYSNEVNHISDNDYLETERKHLKHLLNRQHIGMQRQLNGQNINKHSNYELTVACIDRFFVDINNYETQETKQLNRSASFMHKLATCILLINISKVKPLSRSSDHLKLRSKLLEDQKILAKRFHRETMNLPPSYDKPNQLYQRIQQKISQVRMRLNSDEHESIKSRKTKSIVAKLKRMKTQESSESPSPLKLPQFISTPQLKRGNTTSERCIKSVSQHKPSLKLTTAVKPSKYKKNVKPIQQIPDSVVASTDQIQHTSRTTLGKKVKFPDLDYTNSISQDDSSYLDMQHDIMNHHVNQTLIQKSFLVDKEAAQNYGFKWIKF